MDVTSASQCDDIPTNSRKVAIRAPLLVYLMKDWKTKNNAPEKKAMKSRMFLKVPSNQANELLILAKFSINILE